MFQCTIRRLGSLVAAVLLSFSAVGCDDSVQRARDRSAADTAETARTMRVRLLIGNLGDADPSVVVLSCDYLAEMGPDASLALPALEPLLSHADPVVQKRARKAIDSINQVPIGTRIRTVAQWVGVVGMHILFIVAAVLAMVFAHSVIVSTKLADECLIRCISAAFGVFAYATFRIAGISLPLVVESMAGSSDRLLWTILLPAGLGAGTVAFALAMLDADENRGPRCLLFTATLLPSGFIDTYVFLAVRMSAESIRYAAANMSFIGGMMFWLMMFYVSKSSRGSGRTDSSSYPMRSQPNRSPLANGTTH